MSRSYTDGFSSCNDPRCLVSLSAYVRSSRTACLRITVYAWPWVVTLCNREHPGKRKYRIQSLNSEYMHSSFAQYGLPTSKLGL